MAFEAEFPPVEGPPEEVSPVAAMGLVAHDARVGAVLLMVPLEGRGNGYFPGFGVLIRRSAIGKGHDHRMVSEVFRVGVASSTRFRGPVFEKELVLPPVAAMAENAIPFFHRRVREHDREERALPVAVETDLHLGLLQERDLVRSVCVVAHGAGLIAERLVRVLVLEFAAGRFVALEANVRLTGDQHPGDLRTVRSVTLATLFFAERAVLSLLRLFGVQGRGVASVAECLLGEVQDDPVPVRGVAVLAEAAGHRGMDRLPDQRGTPGRMGVVARGTVEFGHIEALVFFDEFVAGKVVAGAGAQFLRG